MQTAFGNRLLEKHGIDPRDAETFLLIKGASSYVRSDAALEIVRRLPYWRWARILHVVPRTWRNAVYDQIARNRYRWFGKREACFLPTEEERARFIDDEAT